MRASHWTLCVLLAVSGCGGDDDLPGTEAHHRGVGAACDRDTDCTEPNQRCLPFKGGYCGVDGCTSDADCPLGSACVRHGDGVNYCFLLCHDKPECNIHRPPGREAN